MTGSDFDAGPLADVTAVADGDLWTLVFVRDLHHPPASVWAALTRPEQIGEWAPFLADRPLDRPGDATFTMVDGQAREDSPATVLRAEPTSLLEYVWDRDLLRWELAPSPAGTRLTLRHTVHDREWMAQVAAGWHLSLAVAERLLDGRPVPPIRGAGAKAYGWDELRDAYARRLATPDVART